MQSSGLWAARDLLLLVRALDDSNPKLRKQPHSATLLE